LSAGSRLPLNNLFYHRQPGVSAIRHVVLKYETSDYRQLGTNKYRLTSNLAWVIDDILKFVNPDKFSSDAISGSDSKWWWWYW